MTPPLTIQILGWNSAATLPAAAEALQKLSADEVCIRYIDNASTDNSVDIIKELLPQAEIIALPKNLGFAGGHNVALAQCTTPFILTHDPDVILNWAGVQKLLETFSDPKVAAVQGKLYRADGNVLDSTGITLSASFNGIERGANETDDDQFNQPASLIAVTGGCGLYRLDALKRVAHSSTEIFDQDFFAYKEDVDLGWRLHNAGYTVQYLPIIMGTHKRTLGRRGFLNWGLSPKAIYERLRSPRTRYSFRNWLWMMAKNASASQLIIHSPLIAVRLLVFAVLTVLYPPFIKVWGETLAGLSNMRKKRTLATVL